MDEDKAMNVAPPKFRFEWNLNTVVVLVGFASGFVAWGYTLNDMQSGRTMNKNNIDRLDTRLATVETKIQRLDTQELRISELEKTATDAARSMKDVESVLNSLASDVKVTKEILLRIEASQNRIDEERRKP